MKILFIGTVNFSKILLTKLIEMEENIIGVITKETSDFNTDFSDLTELCEENRIPCKKLININSKESVSWVKRMNPDIIFCFGWSSLLKKELLSIPPQGVIGYHPSKLPFNRGRHPIVWALFLGLKQTGSSFFMMTEKADDGDIIHQQGVEIEENDDAYSLYSKLAHTAKRQLEDFIPLIKKNEVIPKKQKPADANTWRKRGKPDGFIDFRMSSKAIYNLVRALTKPYLGAHLLYKGKEIKVWKSKTVSFYRDNLEPGKVLEVTPTNSILVKTYDGAIELIEHSFDDLPNSGEYL